MNTITISLEQELELNINGVWHYTDIIEVQYNKELSYQEMHPDECQELPYLEIELESVEWNDMEVLPFMNVLDKDILINEIIESIANED